MTGYSSSTGFYIHAKTVIADYGTSTAKAFVGSENFSSNSLNDNRELGLITTDSGVISGLESTFNGDFSGSSTDKVSIFSPGTQTSAGRQLRLPADAGRGHRTGTLSYTATGLPAGLSINSSTGVISGTADHGRHLHGDRDRHRLHRADRIGHLHLDGRLGDRQHGDGDQPGQPDRHRRHRRQPADHARPTRPPARP